MEIALNTPALLFPAISLLMLAYTSRFLALANVVRSLHDQYHREPEQRLLKQIENLRSRIRIIRNMQFMGVFSLLLCTLSMFLLLANFVAAGTVVFAVSLCTMISSLVLSMMEIRMSVIALDLHLQDIEALEKKAGE